MHNSIGLNLFQFFILRARRQKLGDPIATRSATTESRTRFEDIISMGGRRSNYFLEDAYRNTGQNLRDASDRTTVRQLAVILIEIAEAWDNAFGHSPPPKVARMHDWTGTSATQTASEAQIRRRMDLQVESARLGQYKCGQAFTRLNELERKL
jgi:hypothetical protein